jgi:hypothetical protein
VRLDYAAAASRYKELIGLESSARAVCAESDAAWPFLPRGITWHTNDEKLQRKSSQGIKEECASFSSI